MRGIAPPYRRRDHDGSLDVLRQPAPLAEDHFHRALRPRVASLDDVRRCHQSPLDLGLLLRPCIGRRLGADYQTGVIRLGSARLQSSVVEEGNGAVNVSVLMLSVFLLRDGRNGIPTALRPQKRHINREALRITNLAYEIDAAFPDLHVAPGNQVKLDSLVKTRFEEVPAIQHI